MANAATDVNEKWSLRLQPVAKFLLKRIDVENRFLSLLTGHHPREENVEARRHSQSPVEGHLVYSMASLERAMGAIGLVLVLCLCEELG